MTNAEIWAIVIGVVCGVLASVPTALLLLVVQARLAMRQQPPAPDTDLYPGQIIIIERPMLKDGKR